LKFLIIIIFSLIGFSETRGQDSIPKNVIQKIESKLESSDLNRSDIWLPQDMIIAEENRLQTSRTLTDNPLKSYDFVMKQAGGLKTLNSSNSWEYMKYALSLFEFDKFDMLSFENSLSSKEIDQILGIKLDSALSFIQAAILRQYITPLIKINTELNQDFTGIKSNTLQFLAENADILMVPPQFSDKTDFNTYYSAIEKQNIQEDKFLRFAHSSAKSKIWSLGLSLYSFLLKQTEKSLKSKNIYLENIKTKIINTKLGRIGLGGKEDNVWDGDYIFILDVGGNDKYNFTNSSKSVADSKKVRYIVDLDGNDTYTGGDFSYGSGYFGINILFDITGNDIYKTGNFTLGSGVFGIGILHDFCGNDTYTSGFASQGAGFYGIGILLDNNGDDKYESLPESQGFGFSKGIGLLCDYSGNDVYKIINSINSKQDKFLAFSQGSARGISNLSSGGIGMLFDFAGNDNYFSSGFSQGASDNYGFGAIYDNSGNDNYFSSFFSKGYGTQGGIGIFLESGGNDKYFSEFFSCGKAADFGSGLFFDLEGNDTNHIVLNQTKQEDFKSFSIFADITGSDVYFLKSSTDTAVIEDYKSSFSIPGICILSSDSTKTIFEKLSDSLTIADKISEINPQRDFYLNFSINSDKLDNSPVSENPDILFSQTTATFPSFKLISNNAKISLSNRKQDAFHQIMKNIGSKNKNEIEIMNYLFGKIINNDSTGIQKQLEDSIGTKNYYTLLNLSGMLSSVKSQKLKQIIQSLISEKHWKKKLLALNLIQNYGDSTFLPFCKKLSNDFNPLIRAEAGKTLSSLMTSDFFSDVKPFLEDERAIVREYTLSGIPKNSVKYDEFKKSFNTQNNFKLKKIYASMLISIDTKTIELDDFYSVLNENPPAVRESFYRSILKSGKEFWRQEYPNILKIENDTKLKELFPEIKQSDEPETKKKKRKSKIKD